MKRVKMSKWDQEKEDLKTLIKESFKSTENAPQTTVDFYRVGKVLGQGAFGKVNLAMHKLC